MSKRNIFAIVMLGAALFAGTAAADGKTKRIYKPGPAPLNVTCPTGYGKTTDGRCVKITTTRTCSPGFTRNAQGQCIRTTQTCSTGFTRTTDGRCVQITQTRPQPIPRPVPRPAPVQQVSLDLSSFSGGVGNGVSGGYYGGSGFVALSSSRSYSGVLDSAASVFTFNREIKRRTTGGHPKPCNTGCGGHAPKPRPPVNPCMMGCGGGKPGHGGKGGKG